MSGRGGQGEAVAAWVGWALLLSRARPSGRRLSIALTAYVALMFAYGLVNGVEDGWHEQVVKRGWADWRIPSALTPSVSVVWLLIGALAAVIYGLLVLEQRAAERSTGTTSPSFPARP